MNPYSNHSTEYCMYLRKSRLDMEAEARGEGDTLERHRNALLDLARRMGVPITHIYPEVASGETIASRPEMQKLLQDVEAGLWKGVLCMEVERLARGNTSDQGLVSDTFKYSDTKIVTPLKTYDPADEFDEEFFEFGLFRSRMEYKTINRRLQRGRQASLNEGKFIAGKAVYGYERYKLPKQKGWSLRVVPEQAEVVRQIFFWYVHGELQPDGTTAQLGAYAIAKKLDAQGILSPTGGKWPPCTIIGIIKNPTYIGKIRWSHRPTVKLMVGGKRVTTRPVNDEVPLSDGIHEAILDEDIWHKAQSILKGRSHAPVPKSTNIKNPLAGLVYCSKCGHSMERRKFQHGRDMLLCPNKDCDCKASVLEEVESTLLDALRQWLANYKVEMANLPSTGAGGPEEIQKEINQLNATMSTLQKQMDSLYTLVEQGVYTPELFVQRSKALSDQMAGVNQALSDAEARLQAGQRLIHSRFEIIPQIEKVLTSYPSLSDPREKNDLLKQVLEKAVYTKTKGSRWEESDMNLYIFPYLERG